ncbi:MAG: HAD hydrolase family protein [Nitrospirae bacterium]|nr:HAD hydrolase family protein [Nitrospirota bacterium]
MPVSKSFKKTGKPPPQSLLEKIRRLRMIVFDFDGVFTDNRVLVLQDGTEGVLCSRADGFGLDAVRRSGIKLMVLSTEKNSVVGARCKKLSLPCIHGCDNKSETLKLEAEKSGIPLSNIAYMGNDINDLECLKIVGLPVCVSDAYPEVIKASLHVTKAKGGHGAVREFCDFVAKVKTGKTSGGTKD